MSSPAIPSFDQFKAQQAPAPAAIPSFADFKQQSGQTATESHPVLDAVKDFASGAWSKLSPVQILKGMADTVQAAAADPAGTAKNFGKEVLGHPYMALGRALEAAKQGKTEEALAHFDSALSPVGFMTEPSQVKAATPGQRATGFGELAGIGANAYLTAKLPEVAPKVAAKVAEVAKNPDVIEAAGTAAGGFVGHQLGEAVGGAVVGNRLGKALGKYIANAITKEPEGTAAAREAQPPPLPAQVPSATPAAAPLPPSRQLGAGPIVTPPPADTSGVIKGWQPTILENERAVAAAPTPPAPDLDGVAQGMGFKDFASVKDPRAAATIERVAKQLVAPNPAKAAFDASRNPPPPEAAPPGSTAPTPPPPAGPPTGTAATPPAGAINAPAQLPPKLITEGQLSQWANENGLSIEDAETQLAADHNVKVIDRTTLNRTLHAITGDHETLSDVAKSTYRVDSLKKLSDEQMLELADRLSKEQAAPASGSDIEKQLQQSLVEARARRAAMAAKLPPSQHPGKAAFEAARAK